jgi:hypothetical protein
MLLVLLARIVRAWKQALFIVQEDDVASLASPGLQTLLEVQVEGSLSHPKDFPGNCGLDPGNGLG